MSSDELPVERRLEAAGPRVMVLGGTGWVGRHVSAAFDRAGYSVLAVASKAPPKLGDTPFLAMDLVNASPRDIADMLLAERPDVVVNAAGRCWGVSEDVMRCSLFILAQRVVEGLALLPGHRPRFLQLGTVMEYGVTPYGSSITEQTPANPTGPYGRYKLAATQLVLAAVKSGRVDGMVLRLANLAGPGTPLPSLLGKVLEQLWTAYESGESGVVQLAPLRAWRDYLDVRDAADAVVAAARSDLTGRVVPIGTGEAVPVRDLVTTQIAVSGVEAELVEREPVEGARASTGSGGEWLRVDPEPAREHFGWSAHRPLKDALRDDWEQFKYIRRTGS
ncbi:NAD-dependent epimerase/dehydratase family protein [Streptomyces inhibens]|uniref:NAD-dependent epimerase/dehydratase family protein n=1 Tax=Streptomyces inhibens TaxID=2293571 RepID=UPI001EE6E300|nr:NAD-dependent epimerase/dehydratase family protein [Streptomyces inhibens]UKY51796.1 NAD-dependent epimerase/dehydratase family protein [Streptomyces inhibens]